MSILYWISYRIHSNEGREERYRELISAISNAAIAEWRETTSFHIIRSELGIRELAHSLKKAIDPTVDRILIRQMDKQQAVYTGNISNPTLLNNFIPYALPV